uniref:CHK domain-containing protein n=1 Tax=Caenorhabditis tropicalis TaxID=1561998 RepID=A0A1I7U7Y2_9PELO
MSLYEAADGILETHVTWEDVEKQMQTTFGTKATFGEKKKTTNISDLKGFMSKIAMVEPDWQNVEEGKTLPDKFVVKISSQLAFAALSKVMKFDGEDGFSEEKLKKLGVLTRDVHNREVEVYKLLVRFNHNDIPYTKVYGLKSFEDENDLKGYMILDFVPNIHSLSMHDSIPVDTLEHLIRGVSTFSALAETLSPEEKAFAGGPEYLELFFHEIFNDEQLERQFNTLRSSFNGEHSNLVEESIKILQHYKSLVRKYTKISELLGFKLVMNHGDLWQTNMLLTNNKEGKLKLEAIIDWQAVATLSSGLDLSRLLMGCLNAEDRRNRGNELLKLYHETFTNVLGKELFSFQELQDSYNLYFPMMAIALLPMAITFLENSGTIPDEEKANVREKTLSKMVAMMEDLIEVHEYNLKNYPEFLRI